MAHSEIRFPLGATHPATSYGGVAGGWEREATGRRVIPILEPGQPSSADDLLVRETNHRWSNDLQLVVGLLALQSRRASSVEARQALNDAMERVSILSRARSAMYRDRQQSLGAALQRVCEALHVQAELRSISLLLEIDDDCHGLSERRITTLALVVNELATNAIKHAFDEGAPGRVRISVGKIGDRRVRVAVEDDGRPFPEPGEGGGVGLVLVKRLTGSIGGLVVPPPPGAKRFELHLPLCGD